MGTLRSIERNALRHKYGTKTLSDTHRDLKRKTKKQNAFMRGINQIKHLFSKTK